MKQKRPRLIVHGTAKQLAEHAAGYSASGEGEYSRRIAGPMVRSYTSVTDLERLLHRARVRASHHPVRQVRQRAGEDARRIEQQLKRGGRAERTA